MPASLNKAAQPGFRLRLSVPCKENTATKHLVYSSHLIFFIYMCITKNFKRQIYIWSTLNFYSPLPPTKELLAHANSVLFVSVTAVPCEVSQKRKFNRSTGLTVAE